MSGFATRLARSHPRIRRARRPDVGVRFSTQELVRYAGPTQIVLSGHDGPPRRDGAAPRRRHGSTRPWALSRKSRR